MVSKSLAPFESSVYIKSSVSGAVFNGAISDSINTSQTCVALVLDPIHNSKQVADFDFFNYRDVYLSGWDNFFSSGTIKCFPIFLF